MRAGRSADVQVDVGHGAHVRAGGIADVDVERVPLEGRQARRGRGVRYREARLRQRLPRARSGRTARRRWRTRRCPCPRRPSITGASARRALRPASGESGVELAAAAGPGWSTVSTWPTSSPRSSIASSAVCSVPLWRSAVSTFWRMVGLAAVATPAARPSDLPSRRCAPAGARAGSSGASCRWCSRKVFSRSCALRSVTLVVDSVPPDRPRPRRYPGPLPAAHRPRPAHRADRSRRGSGRLRGPDPRRRPSRRSPHPRPRTADPRGRAACP